MRIRIRRCDNKAGEALPADLKRLSSPYVPFERQVIWAINPFSVSYAGPSNHCYAAPVGGQIGPKEDNHRGA